MQRILLESTTATYNLSCDVRNLEIYVSLEHLGAAFGNLPSFADVVGSFQQSGFFREPLVERTATSFEKVKIRWQEKKPNTFLSRDTSSQPVAQIRQTPAAPVISELDENAPEQEQVGESHENEQNEIVEQYENEPPEIQTQSTQAQMLPRTVEIQSTQVQSPTIRRIFTYIDSETSKIDQKILPEKENVESGIFRPRRIAPISNAALKKPVVDRLSEETSRKHRSVLTNVQKMLIMAYCGPMDKLTSEYDPSDEYVLCRIESLNSRTIKFTPDLGTFRLETRYGIYKVTISVEPDLKFDKIELGPRFSLTTEQEEETTTFELPEGQSIWLHYLITIEEGINFPHDGLYVEYTLEIPPNMEILQKDAIFGRTQICFTQDRGADDVAKFSYPIEITLVYNSQGRLKGEIVTWVRLLVKICTEDTWGKHYVDGYASISLPTQPGQHMLKTDTWRPINPYSNLAMLREKFVGQAVDLKFFEYCGSKDVTDQWNKIFSRVGLVAESSGIITLSVNCIQQSKQFISNEILKTLKYGSLLHKIGMSGNLHWRIMKVLMEFEEAKRQLLKLRSRPLPNIRNFG